LDAGESATMEKLRTTAIVLAALLVTASVASAKISPSLNAPARSQGAGLKNIGAQKAILGTESLSGDDDVCLPHVPNTPRRRDTVAPKRD